MRQWLMEALTVTKLAIATKKANMKLRRMRGARTLQHLRKVASVLAFERTKAE